jgi:hypothetical protein
MLTNNHQQPPTTTNTDVSDTKVVETVAVPVVRRIAPVIQKDVLEQIPDDLAGAGCFGIKRIQMAENDAVVPVWMVCISRNDHSA